MLLLTPCGNDLKRGADGSKALMLGNMLMLSTAPFSPRVLISWLEERETAKSSAWKSKTVLSNSFPDYVLRPFFYFVVNLGYVDTYYSKAYKTATKADEHKEYDGWETACRAVPDK